MRRHGAELERRGIAVAVVSFAEPAKLVHYQEQHRWPFLLLADPQRKAYAAFTLRRLSWWRVFSPRTLRIYWRLMREGMARQQHGGDDIYQSGGDFLLDRSGQLLYAHRSQDPADRPALANMLRAIDSAIGAP